MLKISEHFEYYNPDYSNIIEKIKYWNTVDGDFELTDQINFENNEKLRINISRKNGVQYCEVFSSYFIGLDTFKKLNLPVYVESKLNESENSVDYVKMLTEALDEPDNFNHLEGLLTIKYNEPWIEIEQNLQPLLSPFLIAQFLYTVKSLVKKGLKKSYYNKTENLTNRVKGKVLVGAQIKQNILKNQPTKTVCTYQKYGFDTEVNRFLNFVLDVVSSHISNYGDTELQANFREILHYCKGGFQMVGFQKFSGLNFYESNPFYKNYNLAVQLGNQILKLRDTEIHTEETKKHPPFWIDMAKLFELYVFKKLREEFKEAVFYHKKFNKQEPDFLINQGDFKAVVDAKYKPRYKAGNPSMEDARQLAGYTRLNKIYEEFGITSDEVIPAYFIYPKELKSNFKKESHSESFSENLCSSNYPTEFFKDARLSTTYKKMYLQEIEIELQKSK